MVISPSSLAPGNFAISSPKTVPLPPPSQPPPASFLRPKNNWKGIPAKGMGKNTLKTLKFPDNAWLYPDFTPLSRLSGCFSPIPFAGIPFGPFQSYKVSGVIRANRFARFARIGWFARIGNSSDSGESAWRAIKIGVSIANANRVANRPCFQSYESKGWMGQGWLAIQESVAIAVAMPWEKNIRAARLQNEIAPE